MDEVTYGKLLDAMKYIASDAHAKAPAAAKAPATFAQAVIQAPPAAEAPASASAAASVAAKGPLAPDDMLFWFADLFGTVSMTANKIQSIRNVMTANPRIFSMQISLAAYSTVVHRQVVDRVTKSCRLFFEVRLPKHLREVLLNKEIDFIRDVMQQTQSWCMSGSISRSPSRGSRAASQRLQ
jgi:hypothetical protein